MMYIDIGLPSAYTATLGTLPYCLSWRRRTRYTENLCCGRTPLVLIMPAIVDYVSVNEIDGRYCLRLDLVPLILQDVVGLYILRNFEGHNGGNFHCQILSMVILYSDQFILLDNISDVVRSTTILADEDAVHCIWIRIQII